MHKNRYGLLLLQWVFFGIAVFWLIQVEIAGFESAVQLLEPMFYQTIQVVPVNVPHKLPSEQKKYSLNEIVDHVYALESSRGKHDSCKSSGQFNGYGYHVGSCYQTHAQIETIVLNWYIIHLQTMSLSEALCYYNLGKIQTTCQYYQKFLQL